MAYEFPGTGQYQLVEEELDDVTRLDPTHKISSIGLNLGVDCGILQQRLRSLSTSSNQLNTARGVTLNKRWTSGAGK
jgi:hypothetical protein